MRIDLPGAGVAFASNDVGHVEGLGGRFYVRADAKGSGGGSPFATQLAALSRRLSYPGAQALEHPILDPEQWIESRYHAGPFYTPPRSQDFLWPRKKAEFIKLARGDVTEVVLTGAIGSGKTAVLVILAMYDLYRVSSVVSPQLALGLSPTSTLAFVLISLNVTKAKAKLFDPLKAAIDSTPYFQQEFVRDPKRDSALFFPSKNIVVKPGVTGEQAIHSEDVIWAGLSEANFYSVIAESKRKRGDTLDVAQDLVVNLERRMKSRFLREGQLPFCRIVLDTSRQYPDDFAERRIRDAQAGRLGHKAHVVSWSNWEVREGVLSPNGRPYYCGQTFPVEVGDAARHSRILIEEEVPHARGQVIRVPIERRQEFETDLEGALRDAAGIAVLSIHPLISNRNAVLECVRVEGEYPANEVAHPFDRLNTSLRDGAQLLLNLLADPETRRPRVNPSHPRTAHVDFGLTGDCLGLCLGHVAEMVTVLRGAPGQDLHLPCTHCSGDRSVTCMRCKGVGKMTHFGAKARCSSCAGTGLCECPACGGTGMAGVKVVRPRIYTDLMLQVVPPEQGQIQFDDVEALLVLLRASGFSIPVITADGYESAQFLQRQLSAGALVAEKLSVDVSKDPYYMLRNAIYDVASDGRRRLSFYNYPPFLAEVTRVEDRPKKVDHPPGGSKDVADAVTGVVYNCERFPFLQVPDDGYAVSVLSFGD